MEVKAGSCLFHEKKPFEGLTPTNEAKKPVENNSNSPVFVNHGKSFNFVLQLILEQENGDLWNVP